MQSCLGPWRADWNNPAMSNPAEEAGRRRPYLDPTVHGAVVAQLRVIVVRYGVRVCEDARRVEALLRDLAGEHRREIAVLSGAAREGVPSELLASRGTVPTPVLWERLARMLQDTARTVGRCSAVLARVADELHREELHELASVVAGVALLLGRRRL